MTAALVRMRLHAYARSGRIAAPTLATIVLVAALYGGGAAQPGEGYGLSAYLLLPIMAWQTKLLLDTEPDIARRLAVVTIGPRRELTAGLIAAAAAAIPTIVIAAALPWLIGGIATSAPAGGPALPTGILLGLWAHALAVPPALAVGALCSRAITRSTAIGVLALVGGWLLIVVLSLPRSPMRWIAPPAMAVTKAARSQLDLPLVGGLTIWTVAWAAIATLLYAAARRSRT